jgi:hypothetical protein
MIKAKILYDEVARLEQGLYAWLTPGERSILNILGLVKDAPFKTCSSTDLHCTLIYCKGPLPKALRVPDDKVCAAFLTQLLTWEDHKGRRILVAELQSEEIQALHQVLVAEGLKHSYPEYSPHITLAKDVKLDAEARIFISSVNERLKAKPTRVVFDPTIKAAPLS